MTTPQIQEHGGIDPELYKLYRLRPFKPILPAPRPPEANWTPINFPTTHDQDHNVHQAEHVDLVGQGVKQKRTRRKPSPKVAPRPRIILPKPADTDQPTETPSHQPLRRLHSIPPKQPKQRPPKKHTCPTCGKSFTQLSYLAAHNRVHTGEKHVPCQSGCGATFNTSSNMRRHQVSCCEWKSQLIVNAQFDGPMTLGPDVKFFACQKCGMMEQCAMLSKRRVCDRCYAVSSTDSAVAQRNKYFKVRRAGDGNANVQPQVLKGRGQDSRG